MFEASRLLDVCISQVLSMIENRTDWDDLGEEDGVRGSQAFEGENQIIRSIGIIKHTPEEIAVYLQDNTTKKQWDGMLIASNPVKVFEGSFKIMYESFSAPWPVSNRDFVYACRTIERSDGLMLVGKSIDAGVPEKDGLVRGEVIASAFYLKRIGENLTEVTYIVSVDPKGMIPKFIVNLVGKKQCSNVNKIRDALG